MSNLTLRSVPKRTDGIDQLRVNKSARKINGHLGILRFIDKDTNQYVIYCPALEVSGYGETKAKATEMIKFSITELFEYFIEYRQVNRPFIMRCRHQVSFIRYKLKAVICSSI